jgi:amino acid permease
MIYINFLLLQLFHHLTVNALPLFSCEFQIHDLMVGMINYKDGSRSNQTVYLKRSFIGQISATITVGMIAYLIGYAAFGNRITQIIRIRTEFLWAEAWKWPYFVLIFPDILC